MAADQAGDGGNIDDRTAAALEQRQRVFAAQKRAVEVDRHDAAPGGEIGILDCADGDDAGRVHQPVEPSVGLGDRRNHPRPIVLGRHVERLATVAAAGKIAADRRAARCLDRTRNRGADGAGRARHQHDFVFQPGHGSSSKLNSRRG